MSTERISSQGGHGFDLDALRLPPNYGDNLGVKKVLITVPICKPQKFQFFRTHPGKDWRFEAFILEVRDTRETYVVTAAVAQLLGTLAKPVVLYAAIDRAGNPFLIPVQLPGEDGRRNDWHESRAQAVEHAIEKWVRMEANMHAGSYNVLEAQGALADPNWPECTATELFEVAFRKNFIADANHPVVQQLLGKV